MQRLIRFRDILLGCLVDLRCEFFQLLAVCLVLQPLLVIGGAIHVLGRVLGVLLDRFLVVHDHRHVAVLRRFLGQLRQRLRLLGKQTRSCLRLLRGLNGLTTFFLS